LIDLVAVEVAGLEGVAGGEVGEDVEVGVADAGRVGGIPTVESELGDDGDAALGYVLLDAISVNIVLSAHRAAGS
jgi:hypothetical protein